LREKKAAEKALVMEQRNNHDKEQMENLKKQRVLLSLFSDGGNSLRNDSSASVSPEEYDVVSAGVKRKMRLWALRARGAVMRRAKLTDVFKVNPDKEKVLLSFRDICVFGSTTTTRMTADGPKRVTDKKFYLNNATGFIRPGRVTALMGPSGCGKSTLISALSDRVAAEMFSGDIMMNDDIVSPSLVNNVCGFVPQEDIMNSDLTVKENLFYICALRHDPKSPLGNSKNRRNLINELLHAMGLNKVRHSVIGGGAKRGISGGQKKRVNIAMELMHDPQVIFMDEPTSGLDASMSCEFLDFMRHMAIATGVSVVMVIHQPNSDTFHKVDDVILMQPTDEGGRIAYCGPVSRGVTYLSSQILRTIEPYENAADRFIDILSKGSPQKDRHTGERIDKEDGVLLADVYDDDFKASGELWKDVAGVVEPPKSTIISSSQIISVRKKYKRKGPSFPMVALNGGTMFLNMQMNNLAHIIINDATISILCIVLSLMNMKINQLLFVANLLFGLVSGLYGASIFKDYALLKRYKASGINTFALFVGIVAASIPRILLQNAAFNIPFKNINTPLIPGAHLFELTFLGQMTAYCMGMIFCILFPMGGADVNTVMGTYLSLSLATLLHHRMHGMGLTTTSPPSLSPSLYQARSFCGYFPASTPPHPTWTILLPAWRAWR
jgi:ABC-type multidrug transport system ATPase subunit